MNSALLTKFWFRDKGLLLYFLKYEKEFKK